MNVRTVLTTIGFFFLFFFSQIFIFRNIVFFNTAFCFVYVAFLLLLPLELPHIILMLIGFSYGTILDGFYDTIGVNAAACVLITFLRPYIVGLLTPKGGYDNNYEVSITGLGFQWFTLYALVLIIIHHSLIFIIDAWGSEHFLRTTSKIIFSSVFTLFTTLLFLFLFKPISNR